MILKVCVYFFVFLGCALASNYTLDDCPSNLPRDQYLRVFGDSCYSFILSHEREFAVAERECEHRQGHLVTVKNAATQQFLYNTLRTEFHYGGVVWLGLDDRVTEGTYVWVDGSPLRYSHWASGQPGLLGGLEDCAGMDVGKGGTWHDFRCEELFFVSSDHVFVCEYPIGGPPTTTAAMVTDVMVNDTTTGGCPPFQCELDCGLSGNVVEDGCMICECDN